jgi:hypothetical protein
VNETGSSKSYYDYEEFREKKGWDAEEDFDIFKA